jgi:hypothetical protein
MTSKQFRSLIRLAAVHGHRLLFDRNGGNAVFDIANAGTVVSSALRNLAPKLARRIPKRTETVLLTLKRRSFAAQTLRVAENVRWLALVLLPVGLVLLGVAIAIAPRRRRAITLTGIVVGLAGIVIAVALELSKRYVVSRATGGNELTTSEVRGAVAGLWGAYVGDLMTWTLVVTASAWVLAAGAAPVIAPYSATATMRRLRGHVRLPSSTLDRGWLGAISFVVGVIVIVDPGLALRAVAVVGGFALVYFGAGEVLTATKPAQPRERRPRSRRPRRLIAMGATTAAAAAAVVVALALIGGARNVRAETLTTCNGYAQLCDRRLDEVVFAGTHNSMSAADAPGWLIANQDRTIEQQLNDGIRLFKISTHYAHADAGGGVHTDLAADSEQLNRVAAKLDVRGRQALHRLSRSIKRGSLDKSKRNLWLCHTLCELGATRMVDYLATLRRFLKRNPDQVLILFDEDYVSERDLQSAFKRAGLFRYLATLNRNQPLPTLGNLIRAHHNVVVFAQKERTGFYPWNADGFSWIQDTPLGARKPRQFTCELYRGFASNPLLMMNNWADIFPPRPVPNVPLVKRAFVLKRASQCLDQRGKIPNLILTDYYNRGDVLGAVAELNGVGSQRPAPIVPLGR